MSNAQKVSDERLAVITWQNVMPTEITALVTELQALRAAPTPDAHSEVGVVWIDPASLEILASKAQASRKSALSCPLYNYPPSPQAVPLALPAGVVKAVALAMTDEMVERGIDALRKDKQDGIRNYEDIVKAILLAALTPTKP